MSGILFLKTRKLAEVCDFYQATLSCHVWQDQTDCRILRHGNFLFGFCERARAETNGMLTFFYNSRKEVDRLYDVLAETADAAPRLNEKYNIYQFFAKDPEGRTIEIQYFEGRVDGYLSGDDLLVGRRSVRRFLDRPVASATLERVLDLTRFAPTANNTQGFYIKTVTDPKTLQKLAAVRGRSSAPIANAPMAVAICSEPIERGRQIQDGCIAAQQFLLAAWFHGLGTCWMADLDRDDVKNLLGIPAQDYVVTITPLGYPSERVIDAPKRKVWQEFLRE